jgi:hypothetical protein
MPEDFYRVGPAEKRQFDDVGLRACSVTGQLGLRNRQMI